jgi:3-hydroxy acid dehydrogenase / malonic semialdehyde reductase
MSILRKVLQFTRSINSSTSHHHCYPRILPVQHQNTIRNIMTSTMGKRLEGKTILITGASSGIGRSTAFEFARTSPANLKLVLAARRVEALEEIKADIEKEVGSGVKVLPVKLDVANPEEIRGFVGSLPKEYQDIDVLVNNAYVSLLSV